MVTLQQLRYFRELARNGHLTRTAEQLFITQTSLSNTIIHLERQLGVQLFDRVGRTLQLNEVGKLYLQYINEALICLDNAQAVIDNHKEAIQPQVSVAMNSSSVWANLIGGFSASYPSYRIRQVNCEKDAFRGMLLDQKVDFLLTGANDIALSGLEHCPVWEEKLYLCVPRKHRFAQRPDILLSELKGEPFVNLPKSSSFRDFCDALFVKAGFQSTDVLECDYTLRSKLVAAGIGVAITTQTACKQLFNRNDIACIPITDDFAVRTVIIAWNPRHFLSKAAVDFRDYVIKFGENNAPEETM